MITARPTRCPSFALTIAIAVGVLASAARADAQVSFEVLHSFGPTPNIYSPYAGLMQGNDGALYGTTYGSVFKLLPDGTGFTTLHYFGFMEGNQPYGALIQASDGALYGTTTMGGLASGGTAFKILPDGSGFTTLHSFGFVSTDGVHPYGGLIQASDGFLYGTTIAGGANDRGIVFKMLPNGDDYVVLHNFEGSDGVAPYAGLVQASDGALYGTTSDGVAGDSGKVFKILPDGSGF